jgi:bifunctional non-homologous end joining protein LigD
VRLLTRNGHDWTDRFPLIVEAAAKIRAASFVLDGEAALLGVNGISDFDGLVSRRHDEQVQLYAFDILALESDDLRKSPLHLRKNNLARIGCFGPTPVLEMIFPKGRLPLRSDYAGGPQSG